MTGAWQKIAAAGTTVEVQNTASFPAKILQSATAPHPSLPGEVLYAEDDYRKFDAPLPQDLYAMAAGAVGGTLMVQPIGATGGGGGGGGPATMANGADAAEGATTDQPLAAPTSAGTIQGVLRGLWTSFGGPAEAAATTDAGTFSVTALLKRLLAKTPAQTLKAATATFARPANTTAYAAGAQIANNTSQASVTVLSFAGATVTGAGGQGRIKKVTIAKTGATATTIRLLLFSAAPTFTSGDGAALAVSDMSSYIGPVDVQLDDAANGGRIGVTLTDLDYIIASGDTIYGLLEAYTAYTPASAEGFTVRLVCQPTA